MHVCPYPYLHTHTLSKEFLIKTTISRRLSLKDYHFIASSIPLLLTHVSKVTHVPHVIACLSSRWNRIKLFVKCFKDPGERQTLFTLEGFKHRM